MATKKVLVVEEPRENEQIRIHLENTGYQTLTAASGKQALKLCDTFSPQLVLLGLTLPDTSGEALCQTIRKNSRIPIIMLSSISQENDIIRALKLGADDYVSKPFSFDLLSAKIEAVMRRSQSTQSVSKGFIYNDGNLLIDEQRHEVLVNGKHVSLTPNEFSILLTLARNPSSVCSRQDLVKLVIGEDYEGNSRVIDTHIKCIRKKIGDNQPEAQFILTVHGLGYRFGRVS